MTFTVVVRDLALKRKLRRALKLFDDLRPEMEIVGKFTLWDARRRLAARQSKVSIGRLPKSLGYRAYKRSCVVTSTLPYARIQQEGGTIRPRKRKSLAIPLQLDLARKHVWPKHYQRFKSVALVRIKDILWEARVKPKPGQPRLIRPAFVLRKSVTIKGRPYLVKSPELIGLMRRVIVRRFEQWKRGAG